MDAAEKEHNRHNSIEVKTDMSIVHCLFFVM